MYHVKKAAQSHSRFQCQSSVETKCFESEAGGFKKTFIKAQEGFFFKNLKKLKFWTVWEIDGKWKEKLEKN